MGEEKSRWQRPRVDLLRSAEASVFLVSKVICSQVPATAEELAALGVKVWHLPISKDLQYPVKAFPYEGTEEASDPVLRKLREDEGALRTTEL